MFTRIIVFTVAIFLSGQLLATLKIHSETLDNGARLLFVEAPTLPMVDIRLVYDAGSARDGNLDGLASLTNSLLSDGAGQWNADQLAEQFESVGARFGTESLRDMAIVSVRSLTEKDVLKQSIDSLKAVITKPLFNEEDIERQRQLYLVALEKQKESARDMASTAFYEMLYQDHPYAHNPVGSEESIKIINKEQIQAFFSKYYVAKNMVIAIVGALTMSEAKEIAQRLTSDVPPGVKPEPVSNVKIANRSVTKKIQFPATQTQILFGMPSMRRHDPDYYALYTGNHILGGSGLVSILSSEVREKRGLAYAAYSYFLPMRQPGPYLFSVQTRTSKAQESLDVMKNALLKFIEKGPTPQQLEASKQNITGGFPLRTSSNSKIVEYLAMIGFYDLPLDYLETFPEKINAVTLEDIRDAYRRRVKPELFTTIILGEVGEKQTTPEALTD